MSDTTDHVLQDGVQIRVFDRDQPVADLVPLAPRDPHETGQMETVLAGLERRGIVRRGTETLPKGFLRRKLPQAKKGVVAALLEERREGR